MVERICQLWGDGARGEAANGNQPYEAQLLQVDSSKLAAAAGYRPIWPLESALEKTIDWYRAAQAGGDMRALTRAQIEAFSRERAA